ncbi:MAG: DUF1801 domain-containing protein [Nitrososphaerales archaeon]
MQSVTVAGYLDNIANPDLRRLAKKVRLVAKKAIPDAEEGIKMGVPCYSINKKMIALIGDYSNHGNLYFPEGAKLSSDLLEGTGKGMRHIKIAKDADIKAGEISKLLRRVATNAS